MCSGPMSSENEITTGAEMPVDIIALNRALNRLSKLDPRKNDVVHLRYFCGMTIEQIVACLGISPHTIAHDWSLARAWLRRELLSTAPMATI